MYGTFYRKFLFPFYETFLMRRGTLKYLEELERTQWLSEEEIREIQWAKLQRLLQHAYLHVPYYRQKFHEIGA
ncbi:phenylacetate--CoA ligase family protein, partial [Thermococci archaeon]